MNNPSPTPDSTPTPFESLVSVVLEDVRLGLRRIEDRAVNRSRVLVEDAERHVEELERAAKELGQVRGAAAESSFERAADVEIGDVQAGAFDRLADRFLQRVQTALEGLRATDRYEGALRSWAQSAAKVMDRPADVFAAAEDRAPIYDALLEAGASDFQIHADRDVRVGLVVRDLDGRTLLDRTPKAIVEQNAPKLRSMLKARTPALPGSDRA